VHQSTLPPLPRGLPEAPSRLIELLLALFVVSLFTSTAATNIFAALLTAAAIAWWLYFRPVPLLRSPLVACCAAFVAWIAVRDLIAGNTIADALRQVTDFRPFIFLVLWAPLFAHLRHRMVAVGAFFACSAAFWVAALGSMLIAGEPITSPDSLGFIRAHDLAGPLLAIAVLAAAQLAISNAGRRWLWVGLAVLGSLALFFATGRRTGYVAFAVGMGALALFNVRRLSARTVLLGLSGVILLSAFLVASPHARNRLALIVTEAKQFSQTAAQQQGQTNTSTGLRLRFWSVTKEVIASAPLLGVGTSSFAQKYREMDQRMGGSIEPTRNPHNEYLYVMASMGIGGLGLYLAIQWLATRQAAAFRNAAQTKIMWMAMLVFMTSILYNSMVIDSVPGHFYALALLCLAWFPWPSPAATSHPAPKPPHGPS
jgi:O-antigen ligase